LLLPLYSHGSGGLHGCLPARQNRSVHTIPLLRAEALQDDGQVDLATGKLPHLPAVGPVPCADVETVAEDGHRVVPASALVVAVAEAVGADLFPVSRVPGAAASHLGAGLNVAGGAVEIVVGYNQSESSVVVRAAEAITDHLLPVAVLVAPGHS
jgi:hypothetical protein